MPVSLILFFRARIQPLPRTGTTDRKELAHSSKVERNFKETGEMANKCIGALVSAQGLTGTSVLCCAVVLQTLALLNLVTSHSERCRLDMGCVSPRKVVLTPATKTLPERKCPSAALTHIICSQHSTAACGKLGPLPQLIHSSFSACSCCAEGRFRTYPHLHGETSLPFQAAFRSHH